MYLGYNNQSYLEIPYVFKTSYMMLLSFVLLNSKLCFI